MMLTLGLMFTVAACGQSEEAEGSTGNSTQEAVSTEEMEEDVTSGYENGDLVFWPAANNFVILVSDDRIK